MGTNSVDLDQVTMEQILHDTAVLLAEGDAVQYCKTKELEERIKAILREEKRSKDKQMSKALGAELKQLLIENGDAIDKEKFILCMLNIYSAHLDNANKIMKETIKKILNILFRENNLAFSDSILDVDVFIDKVKGCKNIGDIKDKLIQTYINQQEKRIDNTKENIKESQEIVKSFADIKGIRTKYKKSRDLSNEEYKTEIKRIISETINIVAGRKNVKLTEEEYEACIRAIKKCNNKTNFLDEIIKAYKEHEKRRLMEIATKNYIESQNINELMENLDFDIVLEQQVKQDYSKLSEYLRERDTNIYQYYFDEDNNKFGFDVISSRALIGDNIDAEYKYNRKRLEEVVEYLSKKYNTDGETVFCNFAQFLVLKDFGVMMHDELEGEYFRTMILENLAVKKGMDPKEISRLRQEDADEYDAKIEEIDFDEQCVETIAEAVMDYAEHIDMNKFLLITGHRILYNLERENIVTDALPFVKNVIEDILKNINDPNTRVNGRLQYRGDESQKWQSQDVDVSVADLQRCLSKFAGNTYITDEMSHEYRKQIANSEIDFSQIDPDILDIVLTKEEQEEYSLRSDEDFLAITKHNQWSQEKIKEFIKKKQGCNAETLKELLQELYITQEDIQDLYLDGIIDLDVFNELLMDNNFISASRFIEFYKKAFLDEETKEEQEKNQKHFKQYAEVFKKRLLQDEGKEDTQKELMEAILEQIYDEEDANRTIALLYKKKILDLKTVIDWCQEDVLVFLIETVPLEVIIEDINKNQITVSYQTISQAVYKYITDEELSHEEKWKWLTSGIIESDKIVKLFMNRHIKTKEELYQLVDLNLVDHIVAEEAIHARGDVSDMDLTTLSLDDEVQKYVPQESEYIGGGSGGGTTQGEPIYIISPTAREDFILLFNAKPVETHIENPENAFYNYSFYAIPDKNGKIGSHSPVIAERYHIDKKEQDCKSKDNATYIFQYGDRDLLKESINKNETNRTYKQKIYRARHLKAKNKEDGNRVDGRWAYSVAKYIVQTILGSDLSGYENDKDKIATMIVDTLLNTYGENRTRQILEMMGEIDSGLHDIEITPTGILKRKIDTNNSGDTQSDSDSMII